MILHNIISMDKIANRTTITIEGSGHGLKNNVKLRDDNGNEFMINSIALMNRPANLKRETTLVVNQVKLSCEIGKALYPINS